MLFGTNQIAFFPNPDNVECFCLFLVILIIVPAGDTNVFMLFFFLLYFCQVN